MIRIAVDIGGTFTDLVAIDENAKLHALKIRSTPKAPEHAFIHIVERFLSESQLWPSVVEQIIHVGTIGSNLLLGQLGMKIPTTALITTKGFRDVLEIGRQNRSELYNVFFQRPRPIIARKLRFEVEERTGSDGTILTQVNEQGITNLSEQLRQLHVESIAISFLNSYLNPENELRTKDFLEGISEFICTSSEIDPEHREYERTSTTVVNAVLSPLVSKYLDYALAKFREIGVTAPIQLLSSSGGLVNLDVARSKPIVAVESGPAAGVVGAAEIARILGHRNILSLDMGGTTAKAGCIVEFTPLVVPELEVGGEVHAGRAVKGSGYPVRYPSLDLAEVSAGGGTIIWADEIGTLKVGPISAGADPGPACYSMGGKQPTITDANLVLGRLSSDLLGKDLRLDPDLASQSIQTVAQKVGMDVVETAAASIRLANLHMAKAVDIVSLERGYDPRKFSLIAFGGAGPMHAAEIAQEVGVSSLIIPPYPGLFSALGMMMTDMKYASVRGMLRRLDETSDDFFEKVWGTMAAEALGSLKRDGTIPGRIVRSVDVRYFGQGYEIEIEVPSEFNRTYLTQAFESKHESIYGYRQTGEPLEVTALRLMVISSTLKPTLQSLSPSVKEEKPEARRKVWFLDDWRDTPIHWRKNLGPHAIDGPLIVEEYDSTVVVPPNWRLRGSENNWLILEQIQ
jgi:N-methylhydantoinase A